MYSVHVHCRISAEASSRDLSSVKRRGYEPNGVTVKTFDTREALMYYVTSFNYYKRGEFCNHFLESTMCNPNDSCRHRMRFDGREPIWILWDYVVGYFVRDEHGRVIDLRHHIDEVKSFDRKEYYANSESRKEYQRRWAVKEAQWKKARKLLEGEVYWGYYRQVATTNERRAYYNEEAKGLVRGKRSPRSLPSSYDDLSPCLEKTWKARIKAKRQWEVNVPKHMDTVKVKSKAVQKSLQD